METIVMDIEDQSASISPGISPVEIFQRVWNFFWEFVIDEVFRSE
jgi:hypothetical protein